MIDFVYLTILLEQTEKTVWESLSDWQASVRRSCKAKRISFRILREINSCKLAGLIRSSVLKIIYLVSNHQLETPDYLNYFWQWITLNNCSPRLDQSCQFLQSFLADLWLVTHVITVNTFSSRDNVSLASSGHWLLNNWFSLQHQSKSLLHYLSTTKSYHWIVQVWHSLS